MNKLVFTLAIFVLALLLTTDSFSITKTWNGTTTTWSTSGNWSPSGVPGSGDDVVIGPSATITTWPVLSGSTTIKSLTINGRSVSSGDRGGSLTINTNGILLTITGNLTINGATGGTTENTLVGITLTGTSSSVSVGGNINVTNSTNTQPQITLGTGTLSVAGSLTLGTSVTFTVNSGTVNYNGTAQIEAAATYLNLTLSGSGVKTLPASTTVNGTLSIEGTATTAGSSPTYGASSVLQYKGTSLQTASTVEFPLLNGPNSLIINNSNGVSLPASFSRIVAGNVTLTGGLLLLGPNTLTVNGNIINVSPSSSKMIVLDDGTNFGTLKLKTPTNTTYTYSIGDTRGTADYTPLVFNLTSGANSSAFVSVSMKNIKNTNNTSPVIYLNRTWNLSQTGLTSPTYGITFNYVVGDISVPASEGSLYFGEYNGTWTILGPTISATHNFTTTGLTIFSDFTGGEQGLLPVELSSFSSSVNVNNVKLTWITTSETNNQGFEIYRKSEQTNWMKIGFVSGSGTVNTPKTYSYNDNGLSIGKYSYELKQIDFNGNFEFFSMSGITEIGTPKKFEVSQNYPNPFNPVTKIDYQLPGEGKIKLIIYDMLGRKVKNLVNEVKPAGFYSAEFDATSIASGIYVYKLSFESSNNNFTITKRMSLIK